MCGTCNAESVSLPTPLQEMTINWCLKRAELVFKCVKGIVILLVLQDYPLLAQCSHALQVSCWRTPRGVKRSHAPSSSSYHQYVSQCVCVCVWGGGGGGGGGGTHHSVNQCVCWGGVKHHPVPHPNTLLHAQQLQSGASVSQHTACEL